MDFHSRLKVETSSLHQQIEQASLLKRITDNQLSLTDYRQLIQKFYGYIAPCEMRIQYSHFKDVLVNREKTPLLKDDLIMLGECETSLASIAKCAHLPALDNHEAVLGYLYVIEGSTLGGQYIAKLLARQLNISETNGAKYFYGYGKKTKEEWLKVCEYINLVTNMDLQNNVIASANLTYTTLYRWLSTE